jgi:hypothetical protein
MAAVDREDLPGDPRGSLGREELHAVGDVRGQGRMEDSA